MEALLFIIPVIFTAILMKKRKELKKLKPETTKEWFKLILDITILIIFIIMILINVYSYKQGYETSLKNCIINLTSPKNYKP